MKNKIAEIQLVTNVALANTLLSQGWDLFDVLTSTGQPNTFVIVRYAVSPALPLEVLTLIHAVRGQMGSMPDVVRNAMGPFSGIT